MKVSKWGNSLAVRIPSTIAEELNLKEGDEIDIHATRPGELTIERELTRQELIESIRKMGRPLPRGFRFDREEANAR